MVSIADDYMDHGMDAMDDDSFQCKACGEILEEGKAYELAGSRWHINCFRCNTCDTQLGDDANLLLLGDGSLICNNCTYSCTACGNKIEDLAILTGDQAFCASCFRCRNCKRKIDNLRYARTSQGIFCMDCHESVMARRRKKTKAAAQQRREKETASPMITDKSLPALPPNAIPRGAFDPAPDSSPQTELSPRPRQQPSTNQKSAEPSSRSSSRPSRSPERERGHDSSLSRDGLTLPSTSYRKNRNSAMYQSGNAAAAAAGGDATNGSSGADDGFFIPVALDPTPASAGTPKSVTEGSADLNKKAKDTDYFSQAKSEKKTDAQSSPHIAFQAQGRQSSSEYESTPTTKPPARKLSKSSRNDPLRSHPPEDQRVQKHSTGGSSKGSEDFKLQEAPKSKRSTLTKENGSGGGVRVSMGPPRRDRESTDTPERLSSSRGSQEHHTEDEARSETKNSDGGSQAIPRKELPPIGTPKSGTGRGHNSAQSPTASVKTAGSTTPARPTTADENALTPTNSRPTIEQKLTDTYMQPRAPPAPPSQAHTMTPRRERDASNPDGQGSPKQSPKLPRWSQGPDFSMDEDMARILGTDEGSSSILRRVSNAVRHGRTNSSESSQTQTTQGRTSHARSVSETTRGTTSPRWPKTPVAEDTISQAREMGSPISLSPSDDPAVLKRQLRSSEQRVAELEKKFSTESDLLNLNKKLVEKRKTVSVLDTQAEIMIRQLEVLAGYVERAKETKKPIDPRELEDSAIKEFVQKLEKVKLTMSATIEQLHEERDALMDEKERIAADRDRALVEFEQLSSKNAQLADMNNDLTHQIQERFKRDAANDGTKAPNGLGIYSHNKTGSTVNLEIASIAASGHSIMHPDSEDQIVEAGPTVVQVRRGQVKKFNWKKGSKAVAQNVAKGVNRAVVAFQQQDREKPQYGGFTGDNIGLPYNMTSAQTEPAAVIYQQGPSLPNGQNRGVHPHHDGAKAFGFFNRKATVPKSISTTNVSTPTTVDAATTLFGSDLTERVDHERRQIPIVVTRCIEEVELRGMDVEGIYRKVGGSSQVKAIQDGFSQNNDFDISDPDLDITAVTSVLKQYFRKLPVPLLTFDVYDRVLESNAIADATERCAHLKKTFTAMPQSHRDCLEFLMFHLGRVAQREQENLMSPKNLAVCFAPTIMRDTSIDREMSDMHAKNLVVQFIIENIYNVFTD